jgi:hypothetical protein
MTGTDHDLYLCCRGDGDDGMAAGVAAGFARLGFRVLAPGRDGTPGDSAARLEAIARIPDFVLLSAPAPDGPAGRQPDSRSAELAHAFKTKRNILVLADPAHPDSLAREGLPGRPPFADWQRVTYDRGRVRESIALVAHRLLSSSEVEDRRFMARVKAAAITVAILLAVAVASRAVPAAMNWWNRPAAPAPLPRFTVYWTATGQQFRNGQWAAFPVTDGSAVAAGDRIRLAFSTGSDGCAYVVARDAQGGLTLLFPGATVRGASRVRAGSVQLAPPGDQWFTVDAASGLAAIYLLAGHDPLENLEELAEETDAGPSPAARMELLSSTVAGLLDGRHAAVPRPIRSRTGREIVDGLTPEPPPRAWPTLTGQAASAPARPFVQTGLLSVVMEIRVRPGPPTFIRE